MPERLSTNFTLSEFYTSHDKGTTWRSRTWPQRPITTRPRPAAELITILQAIRDAVGRPVRVASGIRSVSHNRAVGGSDSSGHQTGAAADIQIPATGNMPKMTPRKVAAVVLDLFNRGLLKDLAFCYIGGTFVHIGVDNEVPRRSIWGAGF